MAEFFFFIKVKSYIFIFQHNNLYQNISYLKLIEAFINWYVIIDFSEILIIISN